MTFPILNKRGFTITELLMVMMIIAILLSISLSAMRTVARHTYKTVAMAELKAIETACQNYYSHYGHWPHMKTADYWLGQDISLILQGREKTPDQNPDNIPFIEFAHLGKDDIPYSIWSESGRFNLNACRYFAAFDTEGANKIPSPFNASDMEKWNATMQTNNFEFKRGVIVWTFNPELTEDNENFLIGSWER